MTNRPVVSRREMLQILGLAAVTTGLVACGKSTPDAAGITASGTTGSAAAGSGTGSAAATSAGSASQPSGAGCGTSSIKLGTNGDANNINPILAIDSDGYWRTDLMFDPLVMVDPKTLGPKAHLATSWDVSKDRKTYTFHLDPKAKFWDGTPLTAKDVEFTVMSILAKDYTGPFQSYWSRLAGSGAVIAGSATSLPGLKVVDDQTITMTLSEPYAGFLTVIARNLKPLPSHLLKDKGPLTTSSDYSHNPVGSGPFKFKSWVPGSSFEVEANADYWGEKACMGGITQTVIPDMNTLSQGVTSGQFDATIVAPQSSLHELRQNADLAVHLVDSTAGEAWYLNLRKAPWKDNLKLRQAMARAVDFITFQKKFMYIDDPVPATFYEYASWAYDKAAAVPTYDPDKAKALLAEAGYPGGKGLTFEIITNAGNQYREQEQVYIQAALAELGVKVTVKSYEWATFIGEVKKGTFDTAVLSTTTAIPDPTAMDTALVTDGPTNYSGYANADLDKMLATAGAELDQTKRKAIYTDVQKLLVAELPYIPTAWYPNSLVINKKYGNVDPSVIGPFWNIAQLTES
ncbi:MAG: ABC transporter substrate-binding protein [Nakamurella sp.]